jgi:hypothetical protein
VHNAIAPLPRLRVCHFLDLHRVHQLLPNLPRLLHALAVHEMVRAPLVAKACGCSRGGWMGADARESRVVLPSATCPMARCRPHTHAGVTAHTPAPDFFHSWYTFRYVRWSDSGTKNFSRAASLSASRSLGLGTPAPHPPARRRPSRACHMRTVGSGSTSS